VVVELPAWSLDRKIVGAMALPAGLPIPRARDWAWKGSRGAGVRVCVIDSGIDASHPHVGGVDGAVFLHLDGDGEIAVEDDEEGDLFGHGTACAGIIRSLAPECEIHSVRVLGRALTGQGRILLAGIEWAIEQRFDVISLSLSTTKSDFAADLRELVDRAYFGGSLIVSSAHNMPVESYPWRFSAVVSVASHSGRDPFEFYSNPEPPVEFAARGVDVDVAWLGGSTIRTSGNSFATPHIAGIVALMLSKHPGMTPFETKSLLRATATNVGQAP
jgi:subtilisin family serine protease